MGKHPDVAVVGGGIIGLTCAYFLRRAGLSVEVFDSGDMGREASWAGAGIIPPGNPAGAATPIDKLRAIGSQRFPEFSAELRGLAGFDNGYLKCGGIEFIEEDASEILELWQREGIVCGRLPHAVLQTYEPNLGRVPGEPYYLPDCAQVRNPRHLQALLAACERIGVQLHPKSPVDGFQKPRPSDVLERPLSAAESHPRSWIRKLFSRSDPPQAGAEEPQEFVELLVGGRRAAGRVLIAAGPWSENILKHHVPTGIHPVRGQIVLLKTPEPVLKRVLMLGKRYLVPRADGHVLIGSTEEPEAGFEKANTAEAVADLIGLATRTVPALASAVLVKCWSGLRPATPDGLPFIGPVPGWDNVFVATGHFRAGVQLSIGTAQAITELFTGKPTCVPLEAFAVDRKPHAGGPAAFRS